MSFTRRLPLTFALALALCAVAAAQTSEVSESARAEAPPVAVVATAERVRVSAPAAVVQLRLEVYDEAGRKVFDTEQRGGSVLDWHLQSGAGERVPDGTYVCVVTIKSLNGRLSRRLGHVEVGEGQATARPFEAAQLSAAQAQAVGPVEESAGLSVLTPGGAGAATVLAHNGDAGQLTRTRGDLSVRVGDFFAGTDREQMRLTEDGRLGIGTDKPEATLDVAGEVRATEGFRFADGSKLSVDEKGALLRTSAAGAPLPGLGASVSAATANRLAKFADAAGTLIDSAITESGGNVGLGTAAPVGSLSIGGSTKPTPMTMNYQYFSPNSIVDQGLIGWNYYWNGAALVRQNTAFTAIRFAANPANANANTSFFATMSNLAGADQTVFTATLDAAG
ncbi:MAG TPA: hypothetical protein VF064_08260, partial [Pyrinomonadaceae bacterium]